VESPTARNLPGIPRIDEFQANTTPEERRLKLSWNLTVLVTVAPYTWPTKIPEEPQLLDHYSIKFIQLEARLNDSSFVHRFRYCPSALSLMHIFRWFEIIPID